MKPQTRSHQGLLCYGIYKTLYEIPVHVNHLLKPKIMDTTDVQGLGKFVMVQKKDYETALTEISYGKKKTHWMWYIFSQINVEKDQKTLSTLGL